MSEQAKKSPKQSNAVIAKRVGRALSAQGFQAVEVGKPADDDPQGLVSVWFEVDGWCYAVDLRYL